MSPEPIKKLEISILYVEDEVDIREAVAETINRRVQTVYLAENGKQGLEMFKQHKPDMVITDIRMPIMDGLEMAKEIKQLNKNTPIIVTTAHEEKDFFLKSIEIGIHSYVVKPIDRLKLKEGIEGIAKSLVLERQVNEQRDCITSLIDIQDDIIIIIESKFLQIVNKAFLDFFGFKDIEDFNGKYKSVLDFFKEKQEYIYKPKSANSNWLEYLLSYGNTESDNLIFKDIASNENFNFLVKFKKLPNSEKFIIIMRKMPKD